MNKRLITPELTPAQTSFLLNLLRAQEEEDLFDLDTTNASNNPHFKRRITKHLKKVRSCIDTLELASHLPIEEVTTDGAND